MVCTAGVLTLVVSGLPFLRSVFWMLELPEHFRVQLAVCLLAEIDVEGRPLHLLATHPFPPVNAEYTRGRDEQLAALATSRIDPGAFVLAGDLNATPWHPLVKKMLSGNMLIDSAAGQGFQPTWPDGLPPLWTILDHVFHSHKLIVRSRSIGPSLGSDHLPVEVGFGFRE